MARVKPTVEQRLAELRPAIVRSASWLNAQGEIEDLIAVGMAKAWQMLSRRRYDDSELRLIVGKARWAMLDYLRQVRPGTRRKPWKRILSLDGLMDCEGHGHGFQPVSDQPSPLEKIERVEKMRALHARLRAMSGRDALIVRELMRGRKQYEIATELGISAGRVSQILKRIKKRVSDGL